MNLKEQFIIIRISLVIMIGIRLWLKMFLLEGGGVV